MIVSSNAFLTKTICLLATGIMISGSPVSAQESDLPKAEEILNRFVKETGGLDAHHKIKTRKQEGVVTILVSGQEIELEIRTLSQYPNKSKVETDLPTGATSTRVFDGEHLWEVGGPMGDNLHDEEMTTQAKENSGFHGVIDWKTNYKTVKTVGSDEIDGKTAFKIKCTTEGGRDYHHWFDKESGLMVKTLSKMELPGMGGVEVQIYHSDYKTIDGIKLSMSNKQVIEDAPGVGTITQIVKIKKTEQNFDIPKDAFAMPEEIKELLDK